VEERPGGELSIDGNSSLGLFWFSTGYGSLVTLSTLLGRRIGGSSIDVLIDFVCASVSDIQS
jgi:hypothetical protein